MPYNVGVDAHITADTPGRIAGKVAWVQAVYLSDCSGGEPIAPSAPGTLGTNAIIFWSQDLAREIFGDPISDATVVNPGTAIAKCQDKAYQRAEQLFTEKLKAIRKCKKDGMKAGSVVDSTTLAAVCASDPQPFAIPDPTDRQAGKAQKIIDDVNANCGPPVAIATHFPGDCSGSGFGPPCATVGTSTVTGLIGVGAVNFFGSTLGDLSVGINATCLQEPERASARHTRPRARDDGPRAPPLTTGGLLMSTKCRLMSMSVVAVTMLVGTSALGPTAGQGRAEVPRRLQQQAAPGRAAGRQGLPHLHQEFRQGHRANRICVTNDTPGKIAGKGAKVTDLYISGKCTGAEPIQQGAPDRQTTR